MAKMHVHEIKGMPPEVASKLDAAGIKDSNQLLERAATASQRRQLAKELGIEPGQLLEYVNRADLARLKGVGTQYANLLEEAGVDSVKELAHRNAENLHQKLSAVAESGGHAKRAPRMDEVESWIEQAKAMSHGAEGVQE